MSFKKKSLFTRLAGDGLSEVCPVDRCGSESAGGT